MPNENQPTPPVNKMGLDELRIKVAELCGWKRYPKSADGFERWVLGSGLPTMPPNFPRDLNACHEFEKTLTDAEHKKYRIALWRAITGGFDTIQRNYLSATAEQRCRAFISTMEDKT